MADREVVEAELDARASVAGGALAAVQQANEKERNSFIAQNEAQREQLLSASAWEFRKVKSMKCHDFLSPSYPILICVYLDTGAYYSQLLYIQQIIMASAKLPGFEGPTVDSAVIAFQSKVCSVLHSAFYLRARVGETSHVNMLNKQLESLEKYIETAVKNEPAEQPQFQVPFQMPPPPQFQLPPPPFNPPPPMPQQQPMMGVTPFQGMPAGFPPQMMHQQGQQTMHPQQFMGQLNPQFQPGH